MENKKPHIVHLEDNKTEQELMEITAKKGNATWEGYFNLEAFKNNMRSEANRPTLGYILDGDVPETQGETPRFLLPDAIDFLRKTVQDSSKIVIYSGHLEMYIESLGLLDLNDVHFFKKSVMAPREEVITKLKAA